VINSLDDDKKVALIKACQMLIYTPRFEHFGIVPLEAMYLERCVLAVNAGGKFLGSEGCFLFRFEQQI
jgi:alpha-1,3/alpha-1,6-mannosyltransferase